jgi:uncharacterized protein (DUF3084 family)
MSDTPETNAAWACFKGYTEPLQDVQDLSRKLERERNEAREELRTAIQERHDFHWALKDAERERDQARDLLKHAQSALDAIHLEIGGWIKTMTATSK